MPVSLTCSECATTFKAKDELIGRRVKCPGCGGPVLVKDPASGGFDVEEYEDYEEPHSQPRMKTCPYCAEKIKSTARTCPHCDSDLTASPTRGRRGRGQSEADREKKESRDRSDGIVLFVTGLIGCLSPIFAVFGIIFLVRRPYSFSTKGLAIAGTVLHCIWTILLVVWIVSAK